MTERLLETVAVIVSETELSIARLGLTSVSAPVIAALPSSLSDGPSAEESRPEAMPQLAEAMPSEIISVPTVALMPVDPLPAPPAIEETASVAPEKIAPAEPVHEIIAVAPEPPAPTPEPPKAESLKTEAPAPLTMLASLGIPEAKIAEPEVKIAAPEVKIEVLEVKAAAPEAKATVPEIKVAALDVKAVAPEVKIAAPEARIAAPAPVAVPPAEEPKAAREDKPDEKQVFASLGLPAAAIADTAPLAADRLAPAEVKAAPESVPPAAEPEDRNPDYASLTSPAGNVPISSPLKIRALTRADIPPPEKFASLGSGLQRDARHTTTPALSGILPPEQQRVAYDAPVVIDQPTSIGRRKWIDDASKYQGLGSPEALLEALRHMGAGAKTLGLPASLWCADFMNLVLRKSGLKTTGSRAAKSYLEYGKKIDEPRVGAIAIFTRGRNGGHIGIVRGTDGNGNPIIISGNHNHKVAEAVYPKSRVIAYVVPK